MSEYFTGHKATTDTPIEQQPIALNLETLLSDSQQSEQKGSFAHLDGLMQSIFKYVMKNPQWACHYFYSDSKIQNIT